jgi:hypothetical protein
MVAITHSDNHAMQRTRDAAVWLLFCQQSRAADRWRYGYEMNRTAYL